MKCKTIKLTALFFLLLAISSCSTSPLSNKNITNISKIGADIKIYQNPYDTKSNNITIKLFDYKFKQIENTGIKIRVNNQELPLHVFQELYYTKNVRYIGEDISVDDSYYFEIQLSDSTILPLAYIKSIPSKQINNVTLDKEGALNKETTIYWNDLEEFNTLTIWKSYRKNDNPNSFGGGPYAKSTIKEKIEPAKKQYTVPVSFYTDSATTATNIYFDFSVTNEGLINPNLITGSRLELNSSIVKSIEINAK